MQFLLFLVLAGADPVVSIKVPEKTPVYTPVIVDLKGCSPGWLKTEITPKPPYVQRLEGGKTLVVLGPPQKYSVHVELLCPPTDKGEYLSAEGEAVFEITGDSAPTPPAPPSPPGPVPPSPNPIPDGKYGLAKVAYDGAAVLPPEARAKSADVSTCCHQLAADVRENKLTLQNMADLMKLQKRLSDSFGDQSKAWWPWLTLIKKSLLKLQTDGTLPPTNVAVADAIDEIAVGVALAK